MEYVFFGFLLIVPCVSIVALLIALANRKRIYNLKKMLAQLLSNGSNQEMRNEIVTGYMFDEL